MKVLSLYLSAGGEARGAGGHAGLHVEVNGGHVVALLLLQLPRAPLLVRVHQPLVVVTAQVLQLRVALSWGRKAQTETFYKFVF